MSLVYKCSQLLSIFFAIWLNFNNTGFIFIAHYRTALRNSGFADNMAAATVVWLLAGIVVWLLAGIVVWLLAGQSIG